MISFENDYSEGAHELILKRLLETNLEKVSGYGNDRFSDSAKARIKEACNAPDSSVFLLVGGTQTNKVVIDSLLKKYQGVIAAHTGHISCHEAGAIEDCGHKVLAIKGENGKIDAKSIRDYLETFYNDASYDHMVFPGMVYISHPTEYGTLYSLEELKAISGVCHSYDIPLFLDGARLGYGLVCPENDITLPDLAKYCDAFYIGGTKVGALCGEAVVFNKKYTPEHFITTVKQNGALLAKGRLCGIQFDTLFTDNLYFNIAKNAIEKAAVLKEIFRKKGYEFFIDSPTNQIFVIMENGKMKELSENVVLSFWEKYDENHTVLRFATSWATNDEDIEALEKLL